MSWLRWWDGTVTDPKWRVVATRSGRAVGDVIAVWAFLLEEARANDGALPSIDVETIGACLGYEPDDVQRIIDAMRAKGSLNAEGVANWRKRQPKREDDSRERVAEWRERKRADREAVTRGNARAEPVTQCNAPEAEAESEADSEAPSLRSGAAARAREPAPPGSEADLRQSIVEAYAAAGSPVVPDTSRAGVWLANGWPAELCVAAIREGLGRKGSAPRSLAYFEPAIRDRIADGAPPDASARAPPRRPPRTMTEALNRRDAHDEPARDPKIIDAIAVSG